MKCANERCGKEVLVPFVVTNDGKYWCESCYWTVRRRRGEGR